MKEVKITLAGKIVGRSRNLRGIISRAGTVGVSQVATAPLSGGRGLLGVAFSDGSTTEAVFASMNVLREWVNDRVAFKAAQCIHGRILRSQNDLMADPQVH